MMIGSSPEVASAHFSVFSFFLGGSVYSWGFVTGLFFPSDELSYG